METLTAQPAACSGLILLQSLRLDMETVPGIACAGVGIFLLLLARGVIGGAAESEERRNWQQRRKRRFLIMGSALILFGGYLFLKAHGMFA